MLDLSKYLNMYNFDYTLPGQSKTVKLRPYGAADLKNMLTFPDEEVEEALDGLLDACIVKTGDLKTDVYVEDLWLQDRFYLLVMLRKITKGTTYRFTYKCPTCQSERILEIDLKKMKIKTLPKNFDFDVELDKNIKVTLKPLTRKAVRLGKELIEGKTSDKPMIKAMDEMMATYAVSIEKITTPDGEYTPPPEEALEFIRTIPDFMYTKIQDWFTSTDYGIEMKTKMKCDYPKCSDYDQEKEEVVPLDNFLS
jgi:hypothetical protein